MKNLSRTLLSMALALTSAMSLAQATKSQLPHDQAVDAAHYLAMQHTFSIECPFSSENKATLEIMGMMVVPTLGLTPAELKVIESDARASALTLVNIPGGRPFTCPTLEGDFVRRTRQVLAPHSAAPQK